MTNWRSSAQGLWIPWLVRSDSPIVSCFGAEGRTACGVLAPLVTAEGMGRRRWILIAAWTLCTWPSFSISTVLSVLKTKRKPYMSVLWILLDEGVFYLFLFYVLSSSCILCALAWLAHTHIMAMRCHGGGGVWGPNQILCKRSKYSWLSFFLFSFLASELS